jgi:hypothetical protein
MLLAESAALELVRRLAPWGAPACDRIVWWTFEREHFAYVKTDTRPYVSYAPVSAQQTLWAVRARRDLPASSGAHLAALWNEEAARGAVVPSSGFGPWALPGRSLAELPNPFESLAAIEATGYETLEWLPVAGPSAGAVILVALTG